LSQQWSLLELAHQVIMTAHLGVHLRLAVELVAAPQHLPH
jgi:hypothetical protein